MGLPDTEGEDELSLVGGGDTFAGSGHQGTTPVKIPRFADLWVFSVSTAGHAPVIVWRNSESLTEPTHVLPRFDCLPGVNVESYALDAADAQVWFRLVAHGTPRPQAALNPADGPGDTGLQFSALLSAVEAETTIFSVPSGQTYTVDSVQNPASAALVGTAKAYDATPSLIWSAALVAAGGQLLGAPLKLPAGGKFTVTVTTAGAAATALGISVRRTT